MFGGSGSGAYQSVGFGATSGGLYFPGAGGTNGIVLTSAWGIRGAFNHNWDPYWSSSLFGSYSSVRYDGGTNDNINGLGVSTAQGSLLRGLRRNSRRPGCCRQRCRQLHLQPRLQRNHAR